MSLGSSLSRRSFVAIAAAAPMALHAQKKKKPLLGLELFSVRNELKQDEMGTVTAVAKMGYDGVEFFSPYFSWTPEYAKQMRKLMDDLGIVCFSTHNGSNAFDPENIQKAIDLNKILGSKFIVMASAGRVEGADGWKKVAEKLTAAAAPMKKAGLAPGFHNHQVEFRPIGTDGPRPMEILAANTPKDVVLQLDAGTCVEVGYSPTEWINKNKGRIKSMHLKEWSAEPGVGYKALFGEGKVPWKDVFKAAESVGGVEHYLIEQEGSRLTPLESAKACLESYKKMRA